MDAAPLFCAGVTVYRALNNAHAGPGQRVAVFGVGGLGHLAVQIARAMGADVIAFDVAEDKLALARTLGASIALNAAAPESAEDGARPRWRACRGRHVGRARGVRQRVEVPAPVRHARGGRAACRGAELPALALVSNEVHIVGSAVGTRDDVRAVLAMAAAGKIHCHTETQPLERINEVFEQMEQGRISGRVVLSLDS